jgi:hypothetical protein
MADFARWVVAAEPALPWEGGDFLAAYAGNRADANTTVLEASAVAGELMKFMTKTIEWTGTGDRASGRHRAAHGDRDDRESLGARDPLEDVAEERQIPRGWFAKAGAEPAGRRPSCLLPEHGAGRKG